MRIGTAAAGAAWLTTQSNARTAKRRERFLHWQVGETRGLRQGTVGVLGTDVANEGAQPAVGRIRVQPGVPEQGDPDPG